MFQKSRLIWIPFLLTIHEKTEIIQIYNWQKSPNLNEIVYLARAFWLLIWNSFENNFFKK